MLCARLSSSAHTANTSAVPLATSLVTVKVGSGDGLSVGYLVCSVISAIGCCVLIYLYIKYPVLRYAKPALACSA